MKTSLSLAVLACLGAALAAGPALSQNLHAHEHGRGALNIVLDGKRLTLELEAPADDIVGFEHRPETPEDTAKLESALAVLGDPAKLFVLPAAAGCTHAGAEAETGLSSGQSEDGHAEFHAHHWYDCADPEALAFVEVRLFEAFPSFHEIDVQYIVGSKQGGAELEHDRTRIDF